MANVTSCGAASIASPSLLQLRILQSMHTEGTLGFTTGPLHLLVHFCHATSDPVADAVHNCAERMPV